MSDNVHALLWNRVRTALETHAALLPGHPTAMETARHAQALLGTNLIVRFVTEYYQERLYGSGDSGLSEADAEQLVAEIEALPICQAAPATPPHAAVSVPVAAPPVHSASNTQSTMKIVTDLDEAVPYGLEELKAQEEFEREVREREAEEERRHREATEAVEQKRLAAIHEARRKQDAEEQERAKQSQELATQAVAARQAEEERQRDVYTAAIEAVKRLNRQQLSEERDASTAGNEGQLLQSQSVSTSPKPSVIMTAVEKLMFACILFSFICSLITVLHDFSGKQGRSHFSWPWFSVPMSIIIGTGIIHSALWLKPWGYRSSIWEWFWISIFWFAMSIYVSAELIRDSWKIDFGSAILCVIVASAVVKTIRFVLEKLSAQKT